MAGGVRFPYQAREEDPKRPKIPEEIRDALACLRCYLYPCSRDVEHSL